MLEPNTMLKEAIEEEDFTKFKKALEIGADVNAVDEEDYTPLMNVITSMTTTTDGEQKYNNMIDLLLKDERLNVNIKNKKNGNTALHMATTFQFQEVVKKLVAVKDIDFFIENNDDKTAEKLARENKAEHIVDIIIDFFIKNADDKTAEKLARENKAEHIADIIIDFFIENNADKTAEKLARENKAEHIVDIIEEFSKEKKALNNQLIKTAVDGNLEKVRKLLDDGAYINSRCERFTDEKRKVGFYGDTPLHLAAYFGHLDIINYLIDKGANINARCYNKNTPLINTIFGDQLEAFKLLISSGININLKCGGGATALQWAVHEKSKEIVETLVKLAESRKVVN